MYLSTLGSAPELVGVECGRVLGFYTEDVREPGWDLWFVI